MVAAAATRGPIVPFVSTPRHLSFPAGVEFERIPLPRGQVAATIMPAVGGQRGVVVLTPGFNGSKEDFVHLLEPLANRGYLTVAFDQLGQFESDQLGSADEYTLTKVGHDLGALLDTASTRFGQVPHLVGHSYGGLVSRQAILSGARPRSYVAMCSGAGALPIEQQTRVQQLIAALPFFTLAQIHQIVVDGEIASGATTPAPEIADFLARRFTGNDRFQLEAGARTLISALDQTAELAGVARAGLPIRVMFGEADTVWSPHEQIEVATALGVDFIAVPGAEHSPAVEAPDATAEALDVFWSSL